MKQKPKPVHVSRCSIIAMCDGRGETTHGIVIDDGIVKEYVGIGWIELRTATKDDYKKYPEVKR